MKRRRRRKEGKREERVGGGRDHSGSWLDNNKNVFKATELCIKNG